MWVDGFWVDGFWVDGFWQETSGPATGTLVLCSAATGDLYDEFVQIADNESYSSDSESYVSHSWESDSDPRELEGLCLRLRRINNPTGTFSVEIRAHAGTFGSSSEPSGSALVASQTFDVADVATSPTNYFFAFEGWTPAANTAYTLVLDMSNVSGDASNRLDLIAETGAEATHEGNLAISTNGTTWTPFSAGDIPFKIYEAAATVQNTAKATKMSITISIGLM